MIVYGSEDNTEVDLNEYNHNDNDEYEDNINNNNNSLGLDLDDDEDDNKEDGIINIVIYNIFTFNKIHLLPS